MITCGRSFGKSDSSLNSLNVPDFGGDGRTPYSGSELVGHRLETYFPARKS